MSATELHELLGAYALDALPDDERADVERLLEQSPEARAELAEHRHVAELLGSMIPAQPPERLWDRISEQIDVPDEAPVAPLIELNRMRRRSTITRSFAAVAAATALILGIAVVAQSQRIAGLNDSLAAADAEISELETIAAADPLDRAAQVAANTPGSTLVSLATTDTSSVQMTVVLLEDGRGYVTGSDLTELGPDRTYQLWALMDDGRIISAAVLGSDPVSDTFVVELDGLAALAITEEITGGVVTSENPPVVVGSVEA